jgi:hypothetical protein
VSIIEPDSIVGTNKKGEPVRASKNVAYYLKKIADCDSICFPIWKTGMMDVSKLIPIVTSGLGKH